MLKEQIIEKAQAAVAEGDWSRAATLWKLLVDDPGTEPEASHLSGLAKALRACGRLEDAEAVIASAVEAFPDNKDVVFEAAEIAHSFLNWSLAEERWRRGFELLGEQLPPTHIVLKRAKALEMLGAFGTGAQLLADALMQTPDHIALSNAAASMEAARLRQNSKPKSNTKPQSCSGVDVTAVCECFWDIEESHDLASWQVNGVYPWPLVRMQIYYSLAQKLGLYDAPHPIHRTTKTATKPDPLTACTISKLTKIDSSKVGVKGRSAAKSVGSEAAWRGWRAKVRKLRSKFGMWRAHESCNGLCQDPETSDRHAVIMATRKISGSEPQSEAVRAELGNRALLLDRPLGGSLVEGAIDFDVLVAHFRTNYRDPADSMIAVQDRMVCADIRDHFRLRLNCDIGDLANQLARAIVNFKSVRTGFGLLWEAYPVKTVFLTNSYGITTRAAMVAAQEAGIRTVEFQHGFISRFHLGYSWPSKDIVPYMPDELWCFGDYWHEVTPLPKNVRGRTVGAPYVKRSAENATVERQDNLVVFSSQGVIGQRLIEWAVKTAQKRPDKKVIFRLHPSEMLEQYDHIEQTVGPIPDNFLISHREPIIFELLAQASVQVGAFSTTLLEGISLGTRTVVVNLPGAEYMYEVIARGDALFVDTIEQLVDQLDDAPIARDPYHYYAEPTLTPYSDSVSA